MEGVIGYVTGFAGNFAPKNWAFCQGQVITIASNTALFSILGTVYGGNGTTTFGLPDLRGRAVMGVGSGPGLTPRTLGEVSGSPTATLTTVQMPAHIHPIMMTVTQASSSTGSSPNPGGAVYAATTNGGLAYAGAPTTSMKPYPGTITMSPNGNGGAFSIQNPVLTLNYIICMFGVFPARN